MKFYSQNGEDQYLSRILPQPTGTCVEFGARDGYSLSNIRHFIDRGWQGWQFDVRAENDVIKAWITDENIDDVFDEHGVPQHIDLLSIDIDSQDYWVWKALKRTAKVVVIEYNAQAPRRPVTVPRDPNQVFQEDINFGASIEGLTKLARQKGMNLIHVFPGNAVYGDDSCPQPAVKIPKQLVRCMRPVVEVAWHEV